MLVNQEYRNKGYNKHLAHPRNMQMEMHFHIAQGILESPIRQITHWFIGKPIVCIAYVYYTKMVGGNLAGTIVT